MFTFWRIVDTCWYCCWIEGKSAICYMSLIFRFIGLHWFLNRSWLGVHYQISVSCSATLSDILYGKIQFPIGQRNGRVEVMGTEGSTMGNESAGLVPVVWSNNCWLQKMLTVKRESCISSRKIYWPDLRGQNEDKRRQRKGKHHNYHF